MDDLTTGMDGIEQALIARWQDSSRLTAFDIQRAQALSPSSRLSLSELLVNLGAPKLTSSIGGNGSTTKYSNGTTVRVNKDSIRVTQEAPTGTRIKPTITFKIEKKD